LPEGLIPPFWDYRIGDMLVRAGYAMATRMAEGKLPAPRIKKPVLVVSSLLRRFSRELRNDRQVVQMFEEPQRRVSTREHRRP
jgi:hypothetical protein